MKVILVIYSLVFIGCATLSTDVTGTYKHILNWEFNTQLHIDSDMHYTYKQRVGNIWLTSEGRWQVNNDTLLLSDTLDYNRDDLKSQHYVIKRRKLVEIQGNATKGLTLIKE